MINILCRRVEKPLILTSAAQGSWHLARYCIHTFPLCYMLEALNIVYFVHEPHNFLLWSFTCAWAEWIQIVRCWH